MLSTGPHEAEAQQQGSSKEEETGSCEVVQAASKGGVGSGGVLFDSSFLVVWIFSSKRVKAKL